MAHTKGPWHYARFNWRREWQERYWYVHGDTQICDEDMHTSSVAVCVVEGNATSHPVCEDNARLISASPTMYEFIARKAQEGDADAAAIIAAIGNG